MKRNSVFMFAMWIPAALLLAFTMQSDFADTLQTKLAMYYQRHVPAKIHLTFNQPKYAPGDTALYKIHFFTADRFLPIGGRQILNVQLVNSQGQIAHEAKVLVVDGQGFNQIPIPQNASPGQYTVVAFNDVMKEYDTSLFFQSVLSVAGPLAMEQIPAVSGLEFYPEGGHMIAGVTNKVVVKGAPNTVWSITSENNHENISFTVNDQGRGLFFLTPKDGEQYFAIGEKQRIDLPTSENDGVALLVSVPTNKSPIRITAQVPPNSALAAERLMLAMSSQGIVYYTAELSFAEKKYVTFSLPQEKLPPGIATITVFREAGVPIAERLVYIFNAKPVKVSVSLTRPLFSTREQIPVELTVTNHEGIGVGASLAVTVYREEVAEKSVVPHKTIVENASVYGDLGGTGTTRDSLKLDDAASLAALDLDLITEQWKRFKWKDIWLETKPASPFRKLLNLEGKAVRKNGEPLPDSTFITFFLQKSVMTYVVDVGPSGEFDFSLLMDFYGDEEVFYKAESRSSLISDTEIILNPNFKLKVVPVHFRTTQTPDEFFKFSIKRKEIEESYAYHLTNRVNIIPPSLNALIEEEVFGADVTVNLDDYYLFPTMTETLREIVPMLQHRRQQNRDVVRLFFDDRDRFSEEQPLFIIDGVITDNTTYFLSLNPADVFSIKVVNSFRKLQAFGSMGKNGIILVETKIPGNASLVPRSDYMFTAKGLEKASPAHSRRHPSPAPRVPDLRTNLYWNPQLKTDASGKVLFTFPASDVTGNFKIKFEGFTDAREPVTAEQNFSVRFGGL